MAPHPRSPTAPPSAENGEGQPRPPKVPNIDEKTGILNALTIDVEDYFQVQAMADRVSRSDWDGFPHRVEHNTNRILDFLSDSDANATFFTLGWVAEHHPTLIRRIVSEGHELASHGMAHVQVFTQTADQFRQDIRRAKALLEDTGGKAVVGYRAATFSITEGTSWAYAELEEAGFTYSSSVYPVKHDLYGAAEAPRFPFYPHDRGGIIEVPLTTVRIGGRNLPCGGGGYFRLLPYPLFRHAIRRVNRGDGRPSIFYFHPWEIDPDQPRVDGLAFKSRFRHYVNLGRMEGKIARLLTDFSWGTMRDAFEL